MEMQIQLEYEISDMVLQSIFMKIMSTKKLRGVYVDSLKMEAIKLIVDGLIK